MPNGNKLNSDDPLLAAQQKRIDAAKARMAARQELLRERQKRDTERLYRRVGEACCNAAADAGFGGPLRQVLERITDERERRFLREKGLLGQ